MRFVLLAVAGALGATGIASAGSPVTGHYVESRSANVYVGACHREGEIQTGGRQAVLAWKVTEGSFQGVDLADTAAVAVVTADRNLELPGARRKAVLFVDGEASSAQQSAMAALVRERAGSALGELTAVQPAPVTMIACGTKFRVFVTDRVEMVIRKKTEQLCCKQPYEVWGRPFVAVSGQNTGYCEKTEFSGHGTLPAWKTSDQNNAFFGKFSY